MGGSSHRCPVCSVPFVVKSSLKEHMRQKHPTFYHFLDKQKFAKASCFGWFEEPWITEALTLSGELPTIEDDQSE